MTRVEERLAELLNVVAPTFEAVAFDDVARRVRRRRAVRWAGVATAATIAAVVAGVSLVGMSDADRSSRLDRASRPATSSSAGLSGTDPWIDAPAPPYGSPSTSPTTPPSTYTRPCTANDVAASLAPGGGATGHHLTLVKFRNTSRSACVLKGYPQVTAIEPGKPAVTGTNGSFFPSPGTANMAPGRETLLGLETLGLCSAHPAGAVGSPYHHISIRLPGGGTVRIDDPDGGIDVICGLHLTEFYVPQPE